MNRLMFAAVLVQASLLSLSGCSVSHAFKQPAPKDLTYINVGAHRDLVRSELGEFVIASDNESCDVHTFPEGSGGGKYFRGVLYSVLDLATLGLTEIITYPIETSIGNESVRVKACYDAEQKLVSAHKLSKEGDTSIL